MRRYITREDAVFAACKVLDKFGGCKMGPLCPDVGCREVRDIIDAFPIIEIPEKHGRLIDADALEDNNITYYAIPVLANVTDGTIREAELVIRLKDLDAAPTIIEADEVE